MPFLIAILLKALPLPEIRVKSKHEDLLPNPCMIEDSGIFSDLGQAQKPGF